jgi:hypothetical protein
MVDLPQKSARRLMPRGHCCRASELSHLPLTTEAIEPEHAKQSHHQPR